MVRMLGFSDEDKQRIGIAQQGTGKGVVRGVLGLPGRLVGGILGGGSADVPASIAPDNQVTSFFHLIQKTNVRIPINNVSYLAVCHLC